jgi:hypothetical protein
MQYARLVTPFRSETKFKCDCRKYEALMFIVVCKQYGLLNQFTAWIMCIEAVSTVHRCRVVLSSAIEAKRISR